jgi:hypothetical protein
MKQPEGVVGSRSNRRSFLRKGFATAGALTVGAGWLGKLSLASGEEPSGSLPRGDAAILRFLCALEIIESDLWQQYAELGAPQRNPAFPRSTCHLLRVARQRTWPHFNSLIWICHST